MLSRTPIKCPLSAPLKPSKPRLSRMAIISSISKKMADDKKRVVKPLSKSGSTPLTKTRPVAAKYLTTPRNKRSTDQNLFRSVRNPKPVNVEVGKSRVVAKALVFSPKKTIKVKTSVELRTPISKLCQGMNKLEISSQRKRVLGYSSKSSKNSSNSLPRRQLSSRVQRKPEEAKSGNSIKTKIKGQLLQQQASMKLLGGDETHSLKNNKGSDNCLDVEVNNTSRSQDTNTQENNSRLQSTNRKENDNKDGNENIASESSRESVNNLNADKSSEGQRDGNEFMDSEDKENAPASDGNRFGRVLVNFSRFLFFENCPIGTNSIVFFAEHTTII